MLEIANDEGMQLLHLAAAEGRVAILRFALQQDNVLPLVSSADKHGWTPLHHGSFHLTCHLHLFVPRVMVQ